MFTPACGSVPHGWPVIIFLSFSPVGIAFSFPVGSAGWVDANLGFVLALPVPTAFAIGFGTPDLGRVPLPWLP